ncbi:SHOCT domain-containing protein [Halosegnis marinus]|uniref:SHOCT domain-containing protein n=1 Tax=Halosegnis marinus TaxID=3034023 RepID=A0ABD5ZNJ9_9EURY|nr:SHOCT domain-containing protein [Halosegnis sp. DT85]
MGVAENLRTRADEVTVFLVLGAGFLALFAGYPYFWAIWVIGFAVVLPLVSILLGLDDEEEEPDDDVEEGEDALDALKRRYADGDLSDEEFERRLERLLETENREDAAAYIERRERDAERE